MFRARRDTSSRATSGCVRKLLKMRDERHIDQLFQNSSQIWLELFSSSWPWEKILHLV